MFILAATSIKSAIDPALLRPGRIGVHFEMPRFDSSLRNEFLLSARNRMPLDLDQQQIERLVSLTENYSAADLENILREAALSIIRTNSSASKVRYTQKVLLLM